MSENADKKQITSKFQKGQSGNPKGKIKGTKNKATLIAEMLLEGELEEICQRLIQEAKSGNMQAIKLVIDRLLPQRRNYPMSIELPQLNNASQALQAMALITMEVSNGNLSVKEGESLARMIDIYVRALEAHDYEMRLNKIEHKANS